MSSEAGGPRACGMEPVGVHDLRHSFASYALTEAKMSLLETSHLLRHANPQVTATVCLRGPSRRMRRLLRGTSSQPEVLS
jgi:integrase